MKIKKINIKNVKSFNEEVKIDFNDKINIFIGANGSGKSNLLDILTIVIRTFFLTEWFEFNKKIEGSLQTNITYDQKLTEFQKYNLFDYNSLDNFIGNNDASEIEISFEISEEDIKNMENIKTHIQEFSKISKNLVGYLNAVNKWNINRFFPGQILDYKLVNPRSPHYNLFKDVSTHSNSPEEYFMQYLNSCNVFAQLSEELGINFNKTYLYFSPQRIEESANLDINLSEENFQDLLMINLRSTSKTPNSLLKLATYHFAEKMRLYELTNKEDYLEKWKKDKEVSKVNKYLGKMGYSFKLSVINPNKNIYELILVTNGKEFHIEQLSSGEKELISFLLGVFTFNIQNGLMIIEEPELHLHPKWQSIIMEIFRELSDPKKENNQFILSTHSPSFITPKTINNVFRVYKEQKRNSSKIKKIETDLNVRPLLHMVKSHNNEKMFFADKVVLVEGIHDRIVFEKLIELYSENDSEVIEVIDVGGKDYLQNYKKLLDSLDVNNSIIADFDYLTNKNIGNGKVRKLFKTNIEKICEKVIKDKKSQDCKSLMEKLDVMIKEGNNLEDLEEIWCYIKSRFIRIKGNLTLTEKEEIKSNVKILKSQNIFILQNGEIEDYLPKKYKKLENTIEFVNNEDIFRQWFIKEDIQRIKEIKSIIFSILKN